MCKLLIREHLKEFELEDTFDGKTIDEIIYYLNMIKEECTTHSNIKMLVKYDDNYMLLFGDRLETDLEYNMRLVYENILS